MARLEFFYDYVSPYSYLASTRLPALAERTGADVAYRPILLGGLLKAAQNLPGVQVPNKRAYLRTDVARCAEHYGAAFAFNPCFPFNTVGLMRGALVALEEGVFPAYHEAVFRAMWAESANLAAPEVVAEVLERAGLDAARLLARTQDARIKEALRHNTDEALERGAFGAPSMFVGDRLYFGNDRLAFVEEALGA